MYVNAQQKIFCFTKTGSKYRQFHVIMNYENSSIHSLRNRKEAIFDALLNRIVQVEAKQ
jgi:hypothetical protein